MYIRGGDGEEDVREDGWRRGRSSGISVTDWSPSAACLSMSRASSEDVNALVVEPSGSSVSALIERPLVTFATPYPVSTSTELRLTMDSARPGMSPRSRAACTTADSRPTSAAVRADAAGRKRDAATATTTTPTSSVAHRIPFSLTQPAFGLATMVYKNGK